MKLTSVKGFFPYLTIVFLNTFVDIGHKILIQDTIYQSSSSTTYTILSSIINALILLPYVFLFTPSGFIADKFPKQKVLKITAAAAVPLTMMITYSYYLGYFWAAFALTLLLAVQSALNSPAKYGYIKEIFGKENLSQANAVVQTLTIVAILGATFSFTTLFDHYIRQLSSNNLLNKSLIIQSFAPAGFLLIIFSLFETLMTYRLSPKEAVDPTSSYKIDHYFKAQHLKTYLQATSQAPAIFTCIIGLSIFWAVNQVLLATYGAFLKEHLGNISVIFAQGSMAVAGIGILLGALYAGRASRRFIETGLIPVAALGIALGLFILPHLSNAYAIISLFLIYGFFGGILIVPLNAIIQFNSPRNQTGKIMAANNFLQNCFMVVFLILTVLLSLMGVNSLAILNGLVLIAVNGAVYTIYRLPQTMLRYILYFISARFYRLNVLQLDKLPLAGGVLLLGNHVSFIDWALLQIACPRPIRFVMEKSIFEKRSLNWLLRKFKVIPIARGNSELALLNVNKALKNGEVVCIFPEGELTKDGKIGKFYTGFERAAVNSGAVIVPFYLDGLWGSKASYGAKQKFSFKTRKVNVIYSDALKNTSKADLVRQKVEALQLQLT